MDTGSGGAVSIGDGADGTLLVALRGEIDYTNAETVVGALCAAVARRRPAAVRIDLAGVTFLDSSGIAVLVKGMKAAREVGAEYGVEAPRPRVLDQLRMTGLTELFAVERQPDPGRPGAR